jgi:hypothetical protein
LARERWLRSVILDAPGLVGLTHALPVAPLRPRETLLGMQPVAAVGLDPGGRSVVVVCSVGVDADLAAEAADYRSRVDPAAHLVVVVPDRDRYDFVERMVKRLDDAELVSMPAPWALEPTQ